MYVCLCLSVCLKLVDPEGYSTIDVLTGVRDWFSVLPRLSHARYNCCLVAIACLMHL